MRNSILFFVVFFALSLSSCNIPKAGIPEQNDRKALLWDLTSSSQKSSEVTNSIHPASSEHATPTPQLISTIDFEEAFYQSQTVSSSDQPYRSGSDDSAQWLYFSPVEYSSEPLEILYAAFQNSGNSVWENDYYLEFYAGKNPSKEDKITIDKAVSPGNEASFMIPIQSTDTSWKSCWQLKNSADITFYEFCYNHGDGTNLTGSQSAQAPVSGESESSDTRHPFTKINGSAPTKYSSDELSAEFLSISPNDGHTFKAYDHSETLSISFKNNGSETWDSSYALVFYSGYNWMHSDSFSLSGTVPSGETAFFTIPIEIYEDNDRWVTCWYLSSPDGQNLSDFCFKYYTKS